MTRNGVTVSHPATPDAALPACTDLAEQIKGRFLIKYLRSGDHKRYSSLTGISHYPGKHYLTPTVLCTETVVSALNLPTNLATPRYANPRPREVGSARPTASARGGGAVEYLLLNGFPADAILPPGWPVEVR